MNVPLNSPETLVMKKRGSESVLRLAKTFSKPTAVQKMSSVLILKANKGDANRPTGGLG